MSGEDNLQLFSLSCIEPISKEEVCKTCLKYDRVWKQSHVSAQVLFSALWATSGGAPENYSCVYFTTIYNSKYKERRTLEI